MGHPAKPAFTIAFRENSAMSPKELVVKNLWSLDYDLTCENIHAAIQML